MIGLIDIGGSGKLSLASVQVNCSIQNLLVGCCANLVYKNNANKDTEGLFLFPLKDHYDVKGIEVDVNGRKLTGQCQESSEAKKLSPILPEMEQKCVALGSKAKDSFKFRIGHIPRGSDVKIILKFLIQLKLNSYNNKFVDKDQFSLLLPSILKPCCYKLGKDNTDDLYYVKNKYIYSFDAHFIGTKTIKEISSSNYSLNLNIFGCKNNEASVLLGSIYEGKSDLDITIYYDKENGPSVFYQYGTASANKECVDSTDFRRSDVAVVNFISDVELKLIEFVLLIDMSECSTGFDINSTKQFVTTFSMNMQKKCRFQIYIIGSNYKKLFLVPQLFDDKSYAFTLDRYKDLKADSKNSSIIESLKDMNSSPLTEDYIRTAILITKGYSQIGDFSTLINKNTVLHRICMDNLASGSTVGVQPTSCQMIIVKGLKEVTTSITDICEKTLQANECVVDGIQWQCPEDVSVEMVQGDEDYVRHHNFLSAFCSIKGLKDTASIKGQISVKMHGKSTIFPIEIAQKDGVFDKEFVAHQLLAKCKLKEMMLEVEKGNEEMKKSLIKLSIAANIKTNYTTFVTVDERSPNRGLIVSDCMDPTQCYKPVVRKKRLVAPVRNLSIFGLIIEYFTGPPQAQTEIYEDSYESVQDYTPAVETENSRLDNDEEFPIKIYINDDNGNLNRKDILQSIALKQNQNGSFPLEDELIWSVGLDPRSVENTHPDIISLKTWMTTIVLNYMNTKLKDRKGEWKLLEEKAKAVIVQKIIKSNKFNETQDGDSKFKAVKEFFKEVTSEALSILKEEDNGQSEITTKEIVECTTEKAKFEILFVVDRSGSMVGPKIECAKACLLLFIRSLPENCKFQIYGFGSSFDKIFNQCQLYSKDNIRIADAYQRNIEADFGGTELFMPLVDIYNATVTSGHGRILFVLTDGQISNENEVVDLVRRNNASTRLFSVGIGDDVSTSLVNRLAEAGRGNSEFLANCTTLIDKKLNEVVIGLLSKALKG